MNLFNDCDDDDDNNTKNEMLSGGQTGCHYFQMPYILRARTSVDSGTQSNMKERPNGFKYSHFPSIHQYANAPASC